MGKCSYCQKPYKRKKALEVFIEATHKLKPFQKEKSIDGTKKGPKRTIGEKYRSFIEAKNITTLDGLLNEIIKDARRRARKGDSKNDTTTFTLDERTALFNAIVGTGETAQGEIHKALFGVETNPQYEKIWKRFEKILRLDEIKDGAKLLGLNEAKTKQVAEAIQKQNPAKAAKIILENSDFKTLNCFFSISFFLLYKIVPVACNGAR